MIDEQVNEMVWGKGDSGKPENTNFWKWLELRDMADKLGTVMRGDEIENLQVGT